MSINAPTKAFPWPSLPIDVAKLVKALGDCQRAKVKYGLGSKAPTMTAVPGKDFKAIDCSGFVRWALYQATGNRFVLADGSVQQHEAIASAGFKRSAPEALLAKDGAVRIMFLSQKDGGGVGHVALVYNGTTFESHGGVGPDSRLVNLAGWMRNTEVYVLVPPDGVS